MTIKPIETRYGGYRFRSRLEARWAVFFDELGVVWDYEPQGFDLGKAGYYLPDFWLEDHGCWFEVKGSDPTDEELLRVQALRDQAGQPVILADGRIGDKLHALFAYDTTDSSGGEFVEFGSWGYVDLDGLLVFRVRSRRRDRTYYADPGMSRVLSWVESEDEPQAEECVRNAYMAARGARFEHGENGRRR